MSENPGNRVALVTGGSRGIGKAIALALADTGIAVAVNYRERGQEAQSVVDLIHQNGGRALAVAADVSVAADVNLMISEVERQIGRIDILVNNAGIAPRRSLENVTEEDFDHTIGINLKSAFLCTQAVLPHMREQRWGRIINMSSNASRAAMRESDISVIYNASKAGIEGLTRGYAARLARNGVTVNAVAPGLIETDMGQPLIAAGAADKIPMGRSGTGEEVAQVIMLLIRDAFITGQTIGVNGGAVLF